MRSAMSQRRALQAGFVIDRIVARPHRLLRSERQWRYPESRGSSAPFDGDGLFNDGRSSQEEFQQRSYALASLYRLDAHCPVRWTNDGNGCCRIDWRGQCYHQVNVRTVSAHFRAVLSAVVIEYVVEVAHRFKLPARPLSLGHLQPITALICRTRQLSPVL